MIMFILTELLVMLEFRKPNIFYLYIIPLHFSKKYLLPFFVLLKENKPCFFPSPYSTYKNLAYGFSLSNNPSPFS